MPRQTAVALVAVAALSLPTACGSSSDSGVLVRHVNCALIGGVIRLSGTLTNKGNLAHTYHLDTAWKVTYAHYSAAGTAHSRGDIAVRAGGTVPFDLALSAPNPSVRTFSCNVTRVRSD